MPIYYHFYVEVREPEGWIVPRDFEAQPWTFDSDRQFGGFSFAHPSRGWLGLFFGRDALLPMRQGPPAERRGSPLLEYLDKFYDYDRDEDQICWLPYSEIMVDCWDTDLVTITAEVPARFALLFGDGRQVFPSAALLGAGMSEEKIERLRNGWLVREPVDTAFGRQRSRITEMPPEHPIDVTWRATIAEFMGEYQVEAFKGLRRYGRDADLRVLSKRG